MIQQPNSYLLLSSVYTVCIGLNMKMVFFGNKPWINDKAKNLDEFLPEALVHRRGHQPSLIDWNGHG